MGRRQVSGLGLMALLVSVLLTNAGPGHATGARHFKSGPIQVTADGAFVWVVNPDHDTVSRLGTATSGVTEFALPDLGTRHRPKGLSLTEDGREVWVACHDSDRVYVLSTSDGALVARIDLPWGSGPDSVALSRVSTLDGLQHLALVACHRSENLALLDVPAHALARLIGPVFRSPHGIVWLDDGVTAWVTHLFSAQEPTFVSRVDLSDPADPRVTTKLDLEPAGPQRNTQLNDPMDPSRNVAEGGYLIVRGHPAQRPSASGGDRVWLPVQYANIHQDAVTPDSIVQVTLRTLDVARRIAPDTNLDKVILTAVEVHDPAGGANAAWQGKGWDAHVSGPSDVGFTADGTVAYLACETSNDVVVFPANTPAFKPGAATPPLVEIPVGRRPIGIALSPTSDVAYVLNVLSRTVSVLDLAAGTELAQVPVTPTTPEPRSLALLEGEHLFHSSTDPRASVNQKVACASCHVNAEHDGRVWDIQNLPGTHGPRGTQSLVGLGLSFGPPDAASGFGQLHRSGDRDEVQDFEHTFQGVQMGGTGFLGAGVNAALGPANGGLDADLDAMAEYVLDLPPIPNSPYRAADGSLTPAAMRGATFFRGASGARPADANCASCHDPRTGFTDRQFHDVGSLRPPVTQERELSARPAPWTWATNTPSLVGTWASASFQGVGFQRGEGNDLESLLSLLLDFGLGGRPAQHGTTRNLTGRQRRDLAEFVLSLDGRTTAAEALTAQDDAPPRIMRVSPTSLTRIEVWFDESVQRASVENPAAWQVVRTDGSASARVSAATLDLQNSDRVTLTIDGIVLDCGPEQWQVVPVGPINDLAASASGGTTHALDTSDASNIQPFTLGASLTVTLGGSGYENLTVPVHDVSTRGPGQPGTTHGSVLLAANPGASAAKGFVRFDWRAAFVAATGVTTSADLLDASFGIRGRVGDSQVIEARRVLLPWSDGGNADFANNVPGALTWASNRHGTSTWNAPNASARTPGVDGLSPADYNASDDLANLPDAVVAMRAINEVIPFAGPGVTGAYRFWFDNPALDHGHALSIADSALIQTRFWAAEVEQRLNGPVLTLTYQVPSSSPAVPAEVSAPLSTVPLLVSRDPAGLRLSFEDVGTDADAYSAYEGTLGGTTALPADWYSHAGLACRATPAAVGGRLELVVAPGTASHYYLMTASNPCAEGTAGTDSFGIPRDPTRLDCAP